MPDEVAWVVGGASGIGAAVATGLRGRGAAVEVLDRQAPLAGGPWQHLDLTERPAVATVLTTLAAATGWPDTLVIAAGISAGAPLEGHPLDLWDRMQAVNLTGPMLVLREALPRMTERGSGRIVALSSGTAVRVGAGTAAYASSKAGLIALVKVAALEGAPHGVTVNAVAPGLTDTPMTREGFGGAEQLAEAVRTSHIANPQGTVLGADDVAGAVLYLCSDQAARVTGQVLHVNGGSIMP